MSDDLLPLDHGLVEKAVTVTPVPLGNDTQRHYGQPISNIDQRQLAKLEKTGPRASTWIVLFANVVAVLMNPKVDMKEKVQMLLKTGACPRYHALDTLARFGSEGKMVFKDLIEALVRQGVGRELTWLENSCGQIETPIAACNNIMQLLAEWLDKTLPGDSDTCKLLTQSLHKMLERLYTANQKEREPIQGKRPLTAQEIIEEDNVKKQRTIELQHRDCFYVGVALCFPGPDTQDAIKRHRGWDSIEGQRTLVRECIDTEDATSNN